MSKTDIGISYLQHLVVELPVGHAGGLAVDYAKVRGNVAGWSIAVDQCHVGEKALAR